jgi:hypothetical protein
VEVVPSGEQGNREKRGTGELSNEKMGVVNINVDRQYHTWKKRNQEIRE